jgi:putative DNA-invertase from lambdoid prophage Rac
MMYVGYARTSTVNQDIENQISQLEKNGSIKVFTDFGLSGQIPIFQRSGFKDLMDYLELHSEIKGIMVSDMSRFSRGKVDMITSFLQLENEGYFICSITDTWTHRPEKDYRESMILSTAFHYANEIPACQKLASSTIAGLIRAKERGKVLGRPFKIKDKRQVVIDLQDAGLSLKEIAQALNVDESTLFRNRQKWGLI